MIPFFGLFCTVSLSTLTVNCFVIGNVGESADVKFNVNRMITICKDGRFYFPNWLLSWREKDFQKGNLSVSLSIMFQWILFCKRVLKYSYLLNLHTYQEYYEGFIKADECFIFNYVQLNFI